MRLILPIAVFAVAGARVAAQGTPCPEFPINESTAGAQRAPSVAAAPNGDFVVVWSSPRGAVDTDIVGRRYDSSGQPVGPEFLVNTYTTGDQNNPGVAVAGSGGFVVVWDGPGGADSAGVFAQRYDASGTPQGGEFPVNTTVAFTQREAAVAAHPAGAFVVVWERYNYPGPRGVFGQRFDASGIPQGAEFQVNTTDGGTEGRAAVSIEPAGGFVAVWDRNLLGASQGVMGRQFGPTGAPLGGEFAIHTPTSYGLYPKVAHGANGAFVVVWETAPGVILGRRFDPAGAAQSPPFPISETVGGAERPAIAGDGQGYVAAWRGPRSGADRDGFARRLDASGAVLGSEFRVNAYTTSVQLEPSLALTPNGGFVAVWQSLGQDGDDNGVVGSLECARLYTVSPCRLADTRDPPGTPLAANSARLFPVTGRCGIPADARAVAVNATAVNPTDFGDLRLYPAGAPAPVASALNFAAGLTRANNAIVPLGADGQLAVQCDMPTGSASTHFVLDAYGYFKR